MQKSNVPEPFIHIKQLYAKNKPQKKAAIVPNRPQIKHTVASADNRRKKAYPKETQNHAGCTKKLFAYRNFFCPNKKQEKYYGNQVCKVIHPSGKRQIVYSKFNKDIINYLYPNNPVSINSINIL